MKVGNEIRAKQAEPMFTCSIEPVNGSYHWLLEEKGKTYGGHAPTQKAAMDEAFRILNAPSIDELITHLKTKTGI